MASLFWTGDNLSPFLKFIMNINSLIGWVHGSARDVKSMKDNVKGGFEGTFSDDVLRYDEVGIEYFIEIARRLLHDVDCRNKRVLDVGCGTGILSYHAMEKGASRLVCGDISTVMLDRCRKKSQKAKIKPDRISFQLIDAESLPFEDNSFDIVMSSMVLGLVPSQQEVLKEMTRVLKPGGILAVSTHGPNIWREPFNAAFMAVLLSRYMIDLIGYRVEFWPRSEMDLRKMLENTRLDDITLTRVESEYEFGNEDESFSFFTSVSGSWWNARINPGKIKPVSKLMLNSFRKKRIRTFTEDVVFLYGKK
jgi:ubiquinone/menaquinone biosynthesis C-methylase UbiE